MRVRVVVVVCLLVALTMLSGGCGGKGGTSPFLDQSRSIGPGLDWSREVTSKKSGVMSFRITCQGPCEVYLLTNDGYQAVLRKDPTGMRAGTLFSQVSSGSTVQGQATVPAGSSWFVIGNKSRQAMDIRLEVFDGAALPGTPSVPAAPAVPVAPAPPQPPRHEVPNARPTERPRMAQPTEPRQDPSPARPPEPRLPPQESPFVKMTAGETIEAYTDAVIHTDNTALIAYPGGILKHVRLPQTPKGMKTYSLTVDPYRMVLDSERGILYAVCTGKLSEPKARPERDLPRGLYGKGDLYTFDVKAVLAGEVADDAKLTHTAKVPIGGTVSTLLLSPDGAWVYFLDSDNARIGRLNTATGKLDGALDKLDPQTDVMCLTPNGKTIYAASHQGKFDHYNAGPFRGTVQVIDTAAFKVEKSVAVNAHTQDIRGTDDGLVFLSAGSGQHVGVTAVDMKKGEEKNKWCVSPGSDMLCLSPDQKLLFISHGWHGTAHIHAVAVPTTLAGYAKDVTAYPGDNYAARRELRMSRDGKYLLCDNGRVIVVEPK